MNQQTQDFPTKSLGISTNFPVISTNPCSIPTTFFHESTNWDLPANSPSISTNPRSVPTTFLRKSTTPGFTYKFSSDINKFPIQINKLKARIYKFQPAIENTFFIDK